MHVLQAASRLDGLRAKAGAIVAKLQKQPLVGLPQAEAGIRIRASVLAYVLQPLEAYEVHRGLDRGRVTAHVMRLELHVGMHPASGGGEGPDEPTLGQRRRKQIR